MTTSEFVSQYTGYEPNNVWSGVKHSRRALTLKFVMLSVRSLCLVQLRGTQYTIVVMCCTHVLTRMCFFSLPCICCMAQAIQVERSGLSDSFSIVAIGHRAVVLRALRGTHGSACPATARAQRVLLEAMFTLNGCEAVLVRVPGGAEAPG